MSTPHEQALLRLVLSGLSMIDWPRLYFESREEAERFLKVNEYDLQRPSDGHRLTAIYGEAVDYLKGQLRYPLPPALLNLSDPIDLFLTASHSEDPSLQSHACSLLKTMSIVNHVDGRELLYNAPISQRELYALVEDKVERELSALLRERLYLVKYEGGRKGKESLVTKLLSKRETIAAQIYDRVRYRIVTRTQEDILSLMFRLFQDILPANYLIPRASSNQLIKPSTFLSWKERCSSALYRTATQAVGTITSRLPFPGSEKEFSGQTYRRVKFVVDIPIRLDRFLSTAGSRIYTESLGTVVYVLVEFQLVDEATDAWNQQGENSHDRYKRRQKAGVTRRLLGK